MAELLVHQAVPLVEELISQFEELDESGKLKDDVGSEIIAATYVLQDCIPVLRKLEMVEVPLPVANAILQIQDDLKRLKASLKAWVPASRTQQARDAAEALAAHKLILNAEMVKCDTRATRASVRRANQRVEERAAEGRDAETLYDSSAHPALEAALLLVKQQGSLKSAAFATGKEKLTIDDLKLLAAHWGVEVPKKLKKKQAIVEKLEKTGKTKRLPFAERSANVAIEA